MIGRTITQANVFVTIQTFGPGVTSTACDGIPRFKLTGPPTRIETRTVGLSYEAVLNRRTTNIATYWTINPTTNGTLTGTGLKAPYPPSCKPEPGLCTQLVARLRREYIPNPDPRVLELEQPYLDIKNDILDFALDVDLMCRLDRGCQIYLGQEVVLLYWPSKPTPKDICTQSDYREASTVTPPQTDSGVTATMSAITFRGQDLYPVQSCLLGWSGSTTDDGSDCMAAKYLPGGKDLDSNVAHLPNKTFTFSSIGPSILYGNFTFVSPTVYLAHHAMTASIGTQSMSMITGTVFPYEVSGGDAAFNFSSTKTIIRSAGVIPLHPNDVSSIYLSLDPSEPQGTAFAQLVAQGKFSWSSYYRTWKTERVDYRDFDEPIPASVYYGARRDDCWGVQTHCATITEGNYRPRLYINNEAWKKIMPLDMPCQLPALVDPNVALSKVEHSEPDSIALPLPKIVDSVRVNPDARATSHPRLPGAEFDDSPDLFGQLLGGGGADPARPGPAFDPAFAASTQPTAGPMPSPTGPARVFGGGRSGEGDGRWAWTEYGPRRGDGGEASSGEERAGWGWAGAPGARGSRGGEGGVEDGTSGRQRGAGGVKDSPLKGAVYSNDVTRGQRLQRCLPAFMSFIVAMYLSN